MAVEANTRAVTVATLGITPELALLAYERMFLIRTFEETLKQLFATEKMPGTVLGVNSLLPYKGRANVLKYAAEHPELRFRFAGAAEGEGGLPANAEYLGPVTETRLKQLYAESEGFIHLPATPQPCERSCIEAKLSGCRMIINGMVGISSYPEWRLPDTEFAKWLSESAAKTWETLEGLA